MRLLVAAAVLTGLASAYLLYPSTAPEPSRAAATLPAPPSRVDAKPAATLAAAPPRPALRLVGVLGQREGAAALIELEAAPARTFHLHDPVAAGWVLDEIGVDSVTLGHGADRMRLALAQRAAASASADKGSRLSQEGGLGLKLPSRPVTVPDEVAREHNRQFLEAVRKRNAGS